MAEKTRIVSPSRTYVAVCNKMNFDGHYFRKFRLPEKMDEVPAHAHDYAGVHLVVSDGKVEDGERRNDTDIASWYFLNVLDRVACIDKCFTYEDFQNITEVVNG